MKSSYPTLFSQLKVGSFEFRNRVITSPVSQPFYTQNGALSAAAHAHLVEQAKGGFAQITLGELHVDPEQQMKAGFDLAGEHVPENVAYSLASLASDVHHYGAMISMEIGHAGSGIHYPPGKSGPVYGPVGYVREDGVVVEEMDEEKITYVCECFAAAARRLQALKFDGAVIHAAHGCLLAQFLSSYTNTRSDQYGGSAENRMRFPTRVIHAVRDAVGPDFLIELRVSGSECLNGGITPEDNIAFCRTLKGLVDLVHVSAGVYSVPELFVRVHPSIYLPNGCNTTFSEGIRKNIDIPVVVVGAVNTPEQVEEIISSEKADLVALGRQSIADPQFVRKAMEGHPEDISNCVRCLNCMDITTGHCLACTVNPRAGCLLTTPEEYPLAKKSKKVVVIGGGPGGMKAALTAARCGHRTVLFEASGSLGGTIRFSDYDSFKSDLRLFKDNLIAQVHKSNVDIRLNTIATPELVSDEEPDAVIAAIGAEPAVPSLPGLSDPAIRHALCAYELGAALGRKIVLIGGGLVGCETGLHLAEQGHSVTILEMADEFARDCQSPHRIALLDRMSKKLTAISGCRCTMAAPHSVCYIDASGKDCVAQADTVLYALGMRALDPSIFSGCAPCFIKVGDCRKVGKVLGAIHQGYYAALSI